MENGVWGGQNSLASHGIAFTKPCFGIVTWAITEDQLFEIHHYIYYGNVRCINLSLLYKKMSNKFQTRNSNVSISLVIHRNSLYEAIHPDHWEDKRLIYWSILTIPLKNLIMRPYPLHVDYPYSYILFFKLYCQFSLNVPLIMYNWLHYTYICNPNQTSFWSDSESK